MSFRVAGSGVKHTASVYVGEGSLDKGASTFQPAIREAVAWAQAKTGVSTVLFISDRASQEFSNVTNLMFLTTLPTLFPGLLFLWAFETPGHGKGVCDGLGAAIKLMIENWMIQQSRSPTVPEVVAFLWKHTKGVPVRGKYAKYKEYRFKEMAVPTSTGPSPVFQTITDTKKFYLYRGTGTVGVLSRRSLPCFCSRCVAQACKGCEGCANTPYCGEWKEYTIKPKSSQSSQQ